MIRRKVHLSHPSPCTLPPARLGSPRLAHKQSHRHLEGELARLAAYPSGDPLAGAQVPAPVLGAGQHNKRNSFL